jgi:bifunctional DNase/RNase
MFRELIERLLGAKKPESAESRPEKPPRPCQRCKAPQTFHITDISRSGELTEAHYCEACAHSVLTTPYQRAASTSRSRQAEVEIEVARLVITEIHDEQMLILREVGGERHTQILIGIFEITALDRFLKGFRAPRPLTHDAWLATIDALDAKVKMACISGRSESMANTFIAELRLDQGDVLARVDARPSDAVLIARMAGAPIYISDSLLSSADEMIQWGV